jgi:hypothetical protein
LCFIYCGLCHHILLLDECNNFKNNPVNLTLEDKAFLYEENRRSCYDDGFRDGKATSFGEKMDSGCGEYGGGYDDGFHAGCRSVNNTYDNCQILSQGYESFCPFHPESLNCVEFLHNATNKRLAESGICAGMGDPIAGLSHSHVH